MKTHSILLGIFLVSLGAFAQSIKDQKLTYSYIQLPSSPFESGTESFTVITDQQFLEANKDSLELYEIKLEVAKELRAEQMKIWAVEKDNLDKAYYEQMSNYEKQLAAGTPDLIVPVTPSVNSCPCVPDPKKPMLTNEFESTSYTNKILIPLFERGDDGAEILVEFIGFSKGLVTEIVKEKEGKITYTYQYQYKYPVKLTVKDQDGSVTLAKNLTSTEFVSGLTSAFNSKYDYLAWKVDNEDAFWISLESRAYNNTILTTNGLLSEKYGFPTKSKSTEIYTAKDKKFDYSDLLEGYQHAKNGYLELANDRDKDAAVTHLIKATEQWESTLKESNTSDKKARINKKVTAAIYVNLAEAYLWMDDFSTAELYANKAKNLSVGKFTRHAKQLIPFIQAQKVRFDAQ